MRTSPTILGGCYASNERESKVLDEMLSLVHLPNAFLTSNRCRLA